MKARTGRGRPPVSPENKLHPHSVRFRNEEWKLINAAATYNNLTLRQFILKMIKGWKQ